MISKRGFLAVIAAFLLFLQMGFPKQIVSIVGEALADVSLVVFALLAIWFLFYPAITFGSKKENEDPEFDYDPLFLTAEPGNAIFIHQHPKADVKKDDR